MKIRAFTKRFENAKGRWSLWGKDRRGKSSIENKKSIKEFRKAFE